uniref:GP-PDE domain-containing protein n=1 Tax=Amblyomma maculatum TaxID=34609 RepID=G3MT88_AMBMU
MWLVWNLERRVAALVLFAALLGLVAADKSRPVYIIAHMANSIGDFDEAMEGGANAVESDVSFSEDGTAAKLFHGLPCDCFRECEAEEDVGAFLEYVRKSTSADGGQYRDKLALLFLDLKVSDLDEERKYGAGFDIAQKLLHHLWHGVPFPQAMNVLLSIPSVTDQEVLRGAIDSISGYNSTLLNKIGFDVSDNDELYNISKMYERLGIQRHRWQGDGITNCLSYLRSADRLQGVIDNRDSQGQERYIEKAYDWTLDLPEEIRRSLRRGVDGIITNRPERMAMIMQESEFKDILRPANVLDNPWTRFVGPSPLPRLSTNDLSHLKDEDLVSTIEDAFNFLGRIF